ncbi:MAG: hypothetical protein D6694_05985, partial [Gammaproteobacteria bacterium]
MHFIALVVEMLQGWFLLDCGGDGQQVQFMNRKSIYFTVIALLLVGSGLPISSDYPEIGQTPWLFNDEFDATASGWDPVPVVTQVSGDYRYSIPLGANASVRTYEFEYSGYYDLMIAAKYIADVGDIRIEFGPHVYNFTTWDNLLTDPEGRKYVIISREKAVAMGYHTVESIRVSIHSGTWSSFGMKAVHIQGAGYVDANPYEYNYLDAGTSEYQTFSTTNGFAGQVTTNALYLPFGLPSAPFNSLGTHQSKNLGMSVIAGIPEVDSFVNGGTYTDFFSAPAMFLESGSYEVTLGLAGASTVDRVNITSGGAMTVDLYFEALGQRVLVGSRSASFNDFNSLSFRVGGLPTNVEGLLRVSVSIDSMLIESHSLQRDLYLYLYQFTVLRRAPSDQLQFNRDVVDGSQTVFTDVSTALNGREAILLPSATADFRVDAVGNVSRVTVLGKDNLHRDFEIRLHVYTDSWNQVGSTTFYSDAGMAIIPVSSSFKDSFRTTLLRLEFLHPSSFFRLQGVAVGGPSPSIFEERTAAELSASYANTSLVYDDGYVVLAESAGMPRPSYPFINPSFEDDLVGWTGGTVDASASDGIKSVKLSAAGQRIISDTATQSSSYTDEVWQSADLGIYDRLSFDVRTTMAWAWDNYGSDTSPLPTEPATDTSSPYDSILFRVKIGSDVIWSSSSYYSGWTTITLPISATGPLTFEVVVRSGRSESQGMTFDPDGNGGIGQWVEQYYSVVPQASLWIDNIRLTNAMPTGVIASYDYLDTAFLDAEDRVLFELTARALSNDGIARHLDLAYRPMGGSTFFTLGTFTILASANYTTARIMVDLSQLKSSISLYGWTQVELLLLPQESYLPVYLSGFRAVGLQSQVRGDQFTNIRMDETPASLLQGMRDDREGHRVEWDHATNVYTMKMTELPREHVNAKVALSEGGRPSLQQVDPGQDMLLTDTVGLPILGKPILYEFRFEMTSPNLWIGFQTLFVDKVPGLQARLNGGGTYLLKDVSTLQVGAAEHVLMFIIYETRAEAFLNGIRMGEIPGTFDFGTEPQLRISGASLTSFAIEELTRPGYAGTGVSGEAYGQQKSVTLLPGNHLGYDPLGGQLNHAMQTKGSGTQNGFWFYVNRAAATSSAVLSVDIRMDGPFYIYIRVTNDVGITYLTYNGEVTSPFASNGYLFLPLPVADINDGTWKTFTVDVQSELRRLYPTGTISTVEAFLIRGTAMLDNLVFQGETIMDAEDPDANVGYIYDQTPAGATLARVQYNRYAGTLNRGIRVQGSGTDNGFHFYINRQALSSAVLSVDLKLTGSFVFYIKVDTNVGITYLTYNTATTSPGSNGAYAFLPLPDPNINDGTWKTFTVDVQSELKRVFPSGSVYEVEGFLIRGTATMDNLVFQGETIMDAEDPSANVGYIYDPTPAGASMTNVLYSREVGDYVQGNPQLEYFNSHYQAKLDIAFSGQKVYFANPAFFPDPSYIEFRRVGIYKEARLYIDGVGTTFYQGLANETDTYWLSISTYPGRDGTSKLSVAFWKAYDLKPLGRSSNELAVGTPSQGHLLIDLPKNEVLRPFFDPASGYIRIYEMQDGFRVEDNSLSGVGDRFATYWLKQDVVNYLHLKNGGYLEVDGNLTHSITFMMKNLFDFNKEYASFKVNDAGGELLRLRVIRNSTRNKIGGALQVYHQGQWSDMGIDFELGRFVSLEVVINSTTSSYDISLNRIATRSGTLSRNVVGTTSMRLETKTDMYVSHADDTDFTTSTDVSLSTTGFLDNSIGNANQYLTVELSATTRTKVILDFMGQSHEQLVYGEETLQVPVPVNQNPDLAVDISSDVPITIKRVGLSTARSVDEFLYLTQERRNFVRQGEVPVKPLLDYAFEDDYRNGIADADHLTYYGGGDHYAAGAQGQAIVLDQGAYLQGQFSYSLPEFTVAFSAKFLEDPSLITASNYQFMANAEGNGKVLFTVMYDPVLRLTVDSNAGTRLSYTAPIPIDNDWHRYVLVYNASHALLYFDGQLAISIPKSGWTAPTPTLFTIGGSGNNAMMVDEYQLFADDYGASIERLTSFDVPSSLPEFFAGFDGTTMDMSGSGGLFNGVLDYGEGIEGQGISFNGFTDSALVRVASLTDFTVSVWFSTSKNYGTQPIIYQKGINSDFLRVGIALVDDQIRIIYSDGAIQTVGTTPIALDTWYHAVLVVEGNTAKLFLDNVLVETLTSAFSLPLDEFRLGAISTPQFKGMVDQLAIYGSVLDEDQRLYLNMHRYGIQSSSASYRNLLPTISFLEPLIYDFEDWLMPEALVGTPYLYADQGRLKFDWQGAPEGTHQTLLNLYDDVFIRVDVSTLDPGTTGAVVFGLFLENGTSVGTMEYRNGWKLSTWDGTTLSSSFSPETLIFLKSGSYIRLQGLEQEGSMLFERTIYSLSEVQFRILHEKQGADLPLIHIEGIEIHPVFSRGDASFRFIEDESLYAGVYEVQTRDLNETPYNLMEIYNNAFAIGKGLSDLTTYANVREKKEVAAGSHIPSVPYTPLRLTTSELVSIQYLLPTTGFQSFYLALDIYDPAFAPAGWGGGFTRTQWVRVVLDRYAFEESTSMQDGNFVINWRDTQSPEGSGADDDLFYFTDVNTVVGGADDIIEVIHPAKTGSWSVVTLDLGDLVQNYVGLRAVFVDTGGSSMRFIPNWHDQSTTGLFPAEGVKSSQGNEWNVIRATETGEVALHNEIYDYRSNRYYATTFATYLYSDTEQRAYLSFESSGIAVLEVGGDGSGTLVPLGLVPGRNLIKFRLIHLPSHTFDWNFKVTVLASENVTISTRDDLDTTVQLATALRERETVQTYNQSISANVAYYPLDGSPKSDTSVDLVETGVSYAVGYNDLGAVLDGNLRLPLQEWMAIKPRGYGMSMWIQPSGTTGVQRLVDGQTWLLDLEYLNASVSRLILQWRSAGAWQSLTSDELPHGTWSHVAVTFGKQATIFVNGISNSTAMDKVDSPQRDLYIGSSDLGTMKYVGMVDEIHFFRKELSDDDVAELISSGGVPLIEIDYDQFGFDPALSYTFELGNGIEDNSLDRHVEEFERSIGELTNSGWTFVQPNANYFRTAKGILELVHTVQGTSEAWYAVNPAHTRIEVDWVTNFTSGGVTLEVIDDVGTLMASIGYTDSSPFIRLYDTSGILSTEYSATGILPPALNQQAVIELRNGTLQVALTGTFSRSAQLLEGRPFGTVKIKFTQGTDPNAIMFVERMETSLPSTQFFGEGIADTTETFTFDGTRADLETGDWTFLDAGTFRWDVLSGTLKYTDPLNSVAEPSVIYDPASMVTSFEVNLDFSTTYMGTGAVVAYDQFGVKILSMGFSDGWSGSNPKGYIYLYDAAGSLAGNVLSPNLSSNSLTAQIHVTMGESITADMTGSVSLSSNIPNAGRTIDTIKFIYDDRGTIANSGTSTVTVDDLTVHKTMTATSSKVITAPYPGTFALTPHSNLQLTQIDDPLEIYGTAVAGGSGWQVAEITFTPDQGFTGFIWDFAYNFASMGKIHLYLYDSSGQARVLFSIYDAWAGSTPGSHYYIYDETGTAVYSYWSGSNFLPSTGTASFGVKLIGNTLYTNVTGVYTRSSINTFGSMDIASIKVLFTRHATYNAPSDLWRLVPDTSTLDKVIQLQSRWGTPQVVQTDSG